MKAKQKRFSSVIAIAVALSILMVSASAVISTEEATLMAQPLVPETVSVHKSIDITEITGEVVEPPMLTSAASSIAKEKEWYEYVYYSPEPVFFAYLSDNVRMSFYDPYDYSSSLVMEVDDTLTDWSSNNSMQVSHTTGRSIEKSKGKSEETTTSTLFGYTDKETTIMGPSTVTTTVKKQTDNYNTSKTVTSGSSDSVTTNWDVGADVNTLIAGGMISAVLPMAGPALSLLGLAVPEIKVGLNESYNGTESDSTSEVISTDGSGRTGYSISNDTTTVENSEQKKTVETTIADRITEVTGEVTSNSTTISFDKSKTITKTYDAAYFNDKGSPLQWKIIEYTVKMPMKIQMEYLIDGEWIYGDSDYCFLNTIQGTCRAWLQNNVAYYEHWGTGEPVTWDEFWSQFFTEEKLIEAYKNRLYPDF